MATHRLTFTERVTHGARCIGTPHYPPVQRGYRRRSLDLELSLEQAVQGAEALAVQHSTGDLITSAELVELVES